MPGKLRPLQGRAALITGATRGIGFAIAAALASQGCNLIITGRDEVALSRARAQLIASRVKISARRCDVRDPGSVNDLFRAIRREFKRIDILINNAGIAHPNLPVEKLPPSTWKDVIETNLTGLFLVSRAAIPLMPRGSAIVNNLSVAANRVFAGSSAYVASKHGALGFTGTLREELRPKGIRVVALLPGATDTDIWNSLWPEAPRQKMMPAAALATAVLNALLLPPSATVETLEIRPSAGTL